jgi:hypothetical protein
MDIVDRLQFRYYELREQQAMGNKNPSAEGLPELLYDASIEIHNLQGLAYAYPPHPDRGMRGITWREEYENLLARMTGMTPKDLSEWQEFNNNTSGTE